MNSVVKFMRDRNVKIAAIQETFFSNTVKAPMGFSLIVEKRPKERGNKVEKHFLLTILSNSALFNSQSQSTLSLISKQLKRLVVHQVVNIYIPPQSSCHAGHTSSIKLLVTLKDAIILGDFNAHSNLWFYRVNKDSRGQKLRRRLMNQT